VAKKEIARFEGHTLIGNYINPSWRARSGFILAATGGAPGPVEPGGGCGGMGPDEYPFT